MSEKRLKQLENLWSAFNFHFWYSQVICSFFWQGKSNSGFASATCGFIRSIQGILTKKKGSFSEYFVSLSSLWTVVIVTSGYMNEMTPVLMIWSNISLFLFDEFWMAEFLEIMQKSCRLVKEKGTYLFSPLLAVHYKCSWTL